MPVSTTATVTASLPRLTFHASGASTSASAFASVLVATFCPVLSSAYWSPKYGSLGRHWPAPYVPGQAAEAGTEVAALQQTATTAGRTRRLTRNGISGPTRPLAWNSHLAV